MPDLWGEGFVVRRPAWHGKAPILADYPGLEEAMRLAGHGHEIVEVPVYAGPPIHMVHVPTWKATVRADTGQVVGIVHEDYPVIQNRTPWEAIDSLFRAGARWETAGILEGRIDETRRVVRGCTYWAMAWLDEPALIPGDFSPTYPFIAATWTHDGLAALRYREISTRIVCANTHHAAMFGRDGHDLEVKVRHVGRADELERKAREAMQFARNRHAAFVEAATELASMPVTGEGVEAFVSAILPMPVAAPGLILTERQVSNVEAARARVRGILDGSTGTVGDGMRNTGWGLLSAGVEYLDHVRPHRSEDSYFRRNVIGVEKAKQALDQTVRAVCAEFAPA